MVVYLVWFFGSLITFGGSLFGLVLWVTHYIWWSFIWFGSLGHSLHLVVIYLVWFFGSPVTFGGNLFGLVLWVTHYIWW